MAYLLSVQGAVNVSGHIDILMITYNRPEYTRLSLTRLLETCDETMRVWLWHNGEHAETLEVVKSLADHPRVHKIHHSKENKKLREPTNWLWQNANGAYLSKVDDDCLVPLGWGQILRRAHECCDTVGIASCWHFRTEDHVPEIARKKVRRIPGGHQIMQNCWTGGSGYLMKRLCAEQQGLLADRQSFTDYGIALASKGWINGWYYPFLYQDHMDDPRSVHCRFKTEADFQSNRTLSADTFGIRSLAEFSDAHHRGAVELQSASVNPRDYIGARATIRKALLRVSRAVRWSTSPA